MQHTSEIELRGMLSKGMSIAEIAERTGIPSQMLVPTLRVLGLRKDGREKGPGADVYLEDLRAGLSMRQIAIKHGKNTETAVYQALRRAGYPTTLRELIRREQKAA